MEIDYYALDIYKHYWKYDRTTFYDPYDPFNYGLHQYDYLNIDCKSSSNKFKDNVYNLKKSPSQMFNERQELRMKSVITNFDYLNSNDLS